MCNCVWSNKSSFQSNTRLNIVVTYARHLVSEVSAFAQCGFGQDLRRFGGTCLHIQYQNRMGWVFLLIHFTSWTETMRVRARPSHTRGIGTVKVKVITVLNYFSTFPWRRIEEWRCNCTFLGFGTRLKWVDSFSPRPLYPRGESFLYPMDRRLGGPQSRSGRWGVD
jgi:hypothetical protein